MLNEALSTPESRRLLKIVDDMREILHHEKISLPHIVVVGDQSVGKSSVLEALSGVQLPRAQNICTRCPLELRMKNIPSSLNEYATIRCDGISEIRMNDFSEIAQKVTDCTLRLAGAQFNVSSSPIYLTVYKKDIQEDLTLIDLPGITRNPVGDQSVDIYQQIVDLIKHYIEPDTAIVLHVIPSLVDFTTSESIKLAKENDPECKRQLIAVSKIDKFDKGIGEKLRGVGSGSMELELGCIAVLNRTQEEIDQNIPFDEMRRREQQFFRSNRAFENVPERYLGCVQLIKRLASIQQDRIRSTLPAIMEDLKKQIKAKKIELKTIPQAIESETQCWGVYNGLIKKYYELINARVHGIYDNDLQMMIEQPNAVNDLTDDHIAYEIHKQQKRCGEKIGNLFSNFFSSKYRLIVLKLIDENAGVALPNFPSFSIIERLYRAEQGKFRRPCEELIESYAEYIKRVLVKLLYKAFAEDTTYRNKMIDKLTDIVLHTIDESEEECRKDVNKMLAIEERIFTLNHYYMDTVNKIRQKFQEYRDYVKANGSKNISSKLEDDGRTIDLSDCSNEHQAALDVQIAISAYCRVVQKRVTDQICQICYYCFITQCALVLDSKLCSAFTSSMLFEWMREPFDQQQKREKLRKSIEAMEKALSMGQNA